MGGVNVPEEDHFSFDVGLGGGEFVLEGVPIAEGTVFDDALEMAGDAGARAENLGVFNDFASNAFQFGKFFGLDDEEAVGDEAAQGEGQEIAIPGGLLGEFAPEHIVGEITDLFEVDEEFLNGRRRELVDSEFFTKVGVVDEVFGWDST
jgi:hypothetical protein